MATANNEARAALAAREDTFALRKWAGFDASERVMGIGTGTPRTPLSLALMASQFSRNKLQRWKDSARAAPPTAATGSFPYSPRNCAEVAWGNSRAPLPSIAWPRG